MNTQPKTTLQILREARELISDPARWTQHNYARNKKGRSVPPESDEAVCWCSVGAIKYAAAGSEVRVRAYYALESVIEQVSISVFNDSRTHAEVLAAFDKAIAKEEAREQAS